MPAKKMFGFELNVQEVKLDLQLKRVINDDVNLYMTEKGVTERMKLSNQDDEVYGYYQGMKTKATVIVKCKRYEWRCSPVGTFTLNGKIYRIEMTDSLPEATHFVTEIHGDERYLDIDENEQPMPEYPQSTGIIIAGVTGQVSLKETYRRLKRMIPAGVDIIEVFVFADDAIYQRFLALYGDKNTTMKMIREYYVLICNQMEDHVEQIKHANKMGVDIEIYVKGIHVSSSSADAPWSARAMDVLKTVNSPKALDIFSEWQKQFRISNNLRYHLALAITG
ncbi:hypothetical protein ACJMK2_024203 [Sinanodonta woodiana]|uniref:Uncharacterized protein n=1 Tax=Sinanodonta woodiana TaxID=1069815 RepID=A0ABD3T7N6_SINWO